MCVDCCKEFGAWCKSFTKSEFFLSILQTLLLIVFFICLTFLILHLHVCFKFKTKDVLNDTTTSVQQYDDDTFQTPHINDSDASTQYGDKTEQSTPYEGGSGQSTQYKNNSGNSTMCTISPQTHEKQETTKLCSWTPSHKTEAVTQYYNTELYEEALNFMKNSTGISSERSTEATEQLPKELVGTEFNDDVLSLEEFDSVEADDVTKGFILALVKITHPKDIMFGCTLTIISEYWTLTAASCVEAVEEVDTLDSFVMLEGLGEERQGVVHSVLDILIHPQYQGQNYSFDLTALKSDDSLVQKGQAILSIATMAEYLLIPIGERLTILGYGQYRSFDQETWRRRAHAMSVFALPRRQCAAQAGGERDGGALRQGEGWAPRHLVGGHALTAAACGPARAACAGVLHARSAPCDYCGGAPVWRARALLGVLGARGCGAGCAPAAYAPLAPHARWLRSLTHT